MDDGVIGARQFGPEDVRAATTSIDGGRAASEAASPILEALPQMAALWRAGRSGAPAEANRKWRAFFGAADWRALLGREDLDALDRGESVEARIAPPSGGPAQWLLLEAATPEGGGRLVSAWPIGRFHAREERLDRVSRRQGMMLEASVDCIKALSPDGALRQMNLAGRRALGVPDDTDYGMEWLSLLAPGIRDAGREALARARTGENARFPGMSQLPDQAPVYWDNLLTPVRDDRGQVTEIVCVSRDVTAERTSADGLREARAALDAALEAETILAREMRHRMRNLLTVITGLASISERAARDDPGAARALGDLRSRVVALARASELVFPDAPDPREAYRDLDPVALSGAVLAPYAGRCRARGAARPLSPQLTSAVVLLLHELATNSLKHGALSAAGGAVDLLWDEDGGDCCLRWVESGGPKIAAAPAREGGGSRMLRDVVCMLSGEIACDWRPEGLSVCVHFPSA